MNNQEKLLLNKQKYENKIFETSKYGNVEILKYENKKEVVVKFINTGNVTTVTLNNLINDRVKDGYAKTICGVGFLGDMKNPYAENRRLYDIWRQILRRCYDETLHSIRPTYKGCIVSENFKNYSYFYEWCNEQKGFNQEGFELDKDLLFKGNTVYSENSCVFLPKELNKVLTNRKRHRGKYPIGVSYHKVSGKFSATCSLDGKSHHLGVYSTVEEAFSVYKETKEVYVKELAIKWKDVIDERAYVALISFTVDIND